MAFFDKAKELAGSAKTKVGDKAKELADSAKANVKIAEEKRRITTLKEQAGQLVWTKYCTGEISDTDIVALCEQIKAAYETIDTLTTELNSKAKTKLPEPAGGSVVCGQCGATIAAGQKFCSACGAKAPEAPMA